MTPVGLVVGLIAITWTGAGLAAIAPAALAITGVAVLGAWDDLASLSPGLRLILQIAAAALVLASLPFPPTAALNLPAGIALEAILLVAAVWFVNLTNFMDGLDLMSVGEFTPALATLAALLLGGGDFSEACALLALAFAGALLGFARLNWPAAKLFLGDSGSLALGLLGVLLLFAVGKARGPAAAVLPFLYYIADSGLTLLRRLTAGERIWEAHRTHFYQRATTAGLSVPQVITRVVVCNLMLCGLAVTAADRGAAGQLIALAAGCLSVAVLLADLARNRRG